MLPDSHLSERATPDDRQRVEVVSAQALSRLADCLGLHLAQLFAVGLLLILAQAHLFRWSTGGRGLSLGLLYLFLAVDLASGRGWG